MTFKDLSKKLQASVQTVPNLINVLADAFATMEGGGSSEVEYSTEEKKIGKWIDGTTDVYEKTIVYETPLNLPYNEWVDARIPSSLNIDTILKVDIVTNGNGIEPNIEAVPGAAGFNIGIQLTINQPNRTAKYLTIRYLKATA